MFELDMLPAQRGDCLWLRWGGPDRVQHALVDGGPSDTIPTLVPELERRITALPGAAGRVELLVITHIDADHIQGVVSLLSDHRRVPVFRDVWFNGFKHLRPGVLGGPDGERLTVALEAHPKRWNRAFGGDSVVVPDDGALPTMKLCGDLEITLLSPTLQGLTRLAPKWESECRKAGLLPGHGAAVPRAYQRDGLLGWNIDVAAATKYRRDRAAPNGSSIAFIAALGGKRVLFGADAHSEVLEAGLDRLGGDVHRFTAIKVSHHGSRSNLSPGFLRRVRCRHWLLSTNGARFGHPTPECVARIITTQDRPVFHLNYVSEHVQDLIAGAGDRYTVRLPPRARDGGYAEGLRVKLL